jgi:hypothetical protein
VLRRCLDRAVENLTFDLVADVSSAQPVPIRAALTNLIDGTVSATSNGFHVEGQVGGDDIEGAHRQLFSTLRRIEPRTSLRAEWTHDGTVYRFVDNSAQGSRSVVVN